MNDLDLGGFTIIGLGFLIIAGFMAFAMFFDSWHLTKSWIIALLKKIFDPDFGLGSIGDDNHRQKHYGNTNIKRPPLLHVHRWKLNKTTKHNWWVFNGLINGDGNDIDKVIKCLDEKPEHSETKVGLVKSWKLSGAEIVHISWNHWFCELCSEKKQTEFYTAPTKKGGMPIFNIDLNKYETDVSNWRRIPNEVNTFVRREVPVETMKKYK